MSSDLTHLHPLVTNPPIYHPEETRISITGGLAAWMLANDTSLAFTSYQTGQLILAGVGPDGHLSFNEQNYARAMGVCFDGRQLHLASLFQIWRLPNILQPGEFANNAFDRVFLPREARTVNYVDAHEIGMGSDGQLIFVNSRYSCLATFDNEMSFRPLWKPSFVSALVPEDRCHLNGLAMADGKAKYVTAVAKTDTREGWRDHRRDGGVLVEVDSGEIVADGLSMPHSPRVHNGHLWVLDSGRGLIVQIDPANGQRVDVAFCPGFLRGLSFVGNYAVVTVSKARDGRFNGLALQEALQDRGTDSRCGVLVIDLATGGVVQSVFFEGKITELFDVALLPGIRNPMSIGPSTVEMIGAVHFSPSQLES